jgi:hypothetical protein|tara:strand:+ start:777 stop:1064 length:288 start_codon:yes stop_codon:yes gene_type:complete
MKDKRTYTNSKEHGEDMSHENEIKIEAGSIPTLIEMHKKEIWEWKQKESEWIKTENLLQGTKKIIDELSAKMIDQTRIILQLEKEIERLVAESKK